MSSLERRSKKMANSHESTLQIPSANRATGDPNDDRQGGDNNGAAEEGALSVTKGVNMRQLKTCFPSKSTTPI